MSARRTPSLEPISSALADALAAHTSDFVGVVDEEGRALFLNRSARGANPGDVQGKLLEEFLSPARARRLRAMLEEARTTGRAITEDDVKIDALDGSERWFIEKCVPVREADGVSRFLLVRTERTHLRRAEEALRLSEVRYRTLFESNPDPVVVVDVSTLDIMAANPAAVRLYGFGEEELRQLPWSALFSDEESESVRACYKSYPPGERRSTARQRRRDGSLITAEIVDNPIVFNGVAARIVVVRDRTDREQLEAQLRHAQKMEAMGVFAGGIAHDFNNLLAVISGCAHGMREMLDGSGAKEDLDTLQDAVVHGANLTKKLMLFCRRFAASRMPVDLIRVVDDLGGVLRRLLGQRVDLSIIHDASSAPIVGDRTELEQLLSNLVVNAGQAGAATIVVRTTVVDVDGSFETRLPRARPGRYVEISVVDDGHGIDPATLPRIFEPFYTTKASGTGLGLAVVHGVVERHEGHLYARSRPGEGTSIFVYLPFAAPPPPSVSPGKVAQRVLFADDDAALRRLTERMLKRLGYDVVSAGDGEEALHLFEKAPESFDLVVLDVIMPKLKGPDALTRMRAIRPEIQALFVSGYVGAAAADVTDRHHELRLLHKPFTAEQLATALRELPTPAPRPASNR